MLPCGGVGAHSVLCLDVCGGYQGKLPGYDKYLYRYYVPGPLPTGGLHVCVHCVDNKLYVVCLCPR